MSPSLPNSPQAVFAGPAQARAAIARGEYTKNTTSLCPGFAQANLVILPQDWAEEFAEFCGLNPRPCPLVEQLPAGDPYTRVLAEHADVRKEVPRYRVWQKGRLIAEPTDITHLWRDDLVSFFLGCSFTFDAYLQEAGLPVRHLEQGRNVPMYDTNLACRPAGRFHGPLVVSMRPMAPAQVEQAKEVSGRFPGAHGDPVHAGDPAAIGIKNLAQPSYGDAVDLAAGEVPLFWACGVTPQAVLMASKPDFAITHAPGHMFICDLKAQELDQTLARLA